MTKARDLAGYAGMENPPTFHTVRSLANSLAKKAQESKEAIQKNNAHKSLDTQLIYQEGLICPAQGHVWEVGIIASANYPEGSERYCRAV